MDDGTLFAWIGLNPFRIQPLVLKPNAPLTWRYRVVTSDRLLTTEFADYQYRNWITDWQIAGLP